MEFIANYGLFFAKSFTVLVAIIIVIVVIALIASREKHKTSDGHIEVKHLNDKIRAMQQALKWVVMDRKELKQQAKADKASKKAKAKAKKKALKAKEAESSALKPNVFVLDFQGDVRASAVSQLREEITALIAMLEPADQVVVRLESQGGMVHTYGLATSQLQRIKNKGAKLTICVDKVAASGGYMMACVADQIVAAPFAVLGSIGVVAQIPNFHRLLDKYNVDYEMHTAGEYKRTLTVFGENTPKGRAKFLEDLEDTHLLFKDFVKEQRSVVDIDKVATGEIWFGRRAVDQNLVDEIKTSDELLLDLCEIAEVYEVKYVEKKKIQEKLGIGVQSTLDGVLVKWIERLTQFRFYQ